MNTRLQNNDRVWCELMARQAAHASEFACSDFQVGLRNLELPLDRAPTIDELGEKVGRLSGFKLVPVDGLLPARDFFAMLRRREFPVVSHLRENAGHLDSYDPDLWHDTFGHLPFLTLPKYVALYELFGQLGANEEHCQSLASLYWYSVEFGLFKERGSSSMTVYGSGLLSSPMEVRYCLSPAVERSEFDPEVVASLSYAPGVMHERLFWVESIDHLTRLIRDWARRKGLGHPHGIQIRTFQPGGVMSELEVSGLYRMMESIYGSTEFMAEAFSEKFPTIASLREKLRQSLLQPGSFFLCALAEDRPIGFLWLQARSASKLKHTAELSVGILATHREQGAGQLLYSRAFALIQQEGTIEIVYAMIREDNAASVAISRKSGFELVATLDGDTKVGDRYYAGLMMRKLMVPIPPSQEIGPSAHALAGGCMMGAMQ